MSTLIVYQGNLNPVVPYQFRSKGVPVNLGLIGVDSVLFSLRQENAATPLLDHVPASIVDSTTGKVQYVWTPGNTNTPGDYQAWFTTRVSATGALQDAPEFPITILSHTPTATSLIATVEDAKQHLGLEGGTRKLKNDEELLLRRLLAGAIDLCQSYTNHRFAQERASVKKFRFDGEALLSLAPFDLDATQDASGIVIQMDSDTAPLQLDATQFRFEPRNVPHQVWTHIAVAPYTPAVGAVNFWAGGDWPWGYAQFGRQVSITATWGWPAIPAAISTGVLDLVEFWWNNRSGELSEAGVAATTPAPVRFQHLRLPELVQASWDPYRRAAVI